MVCVFVFQYLYQSFTERALLDSPSLLLLIVFTHKLRWFFTKSCWRDSRSLIHSSSLAFLTTCIVYLKNTRYISLISAALNFSHVLYCMITALIYLLCHPVLLLPLWHFLFPHTSSTVPKMPVLNTFHISEHLPFHCFLPCSTYLSNRPETSICPPLSLLLFTPQFAPAYDFHPFGNVHFASTGYI